MGQRERRRSVVATGVNTEVTDFEAPWRTSQRADYQGLLGNVSELRSANTALKLQVADLRASNEALRKDNVALLRSKETLETQNDLLANNLTSSLKLHQDVNLQLQEVEQMTKALSAHGLNQESFLQGNITMLERQASVLRDENRSLRSYNRRVQLIFPLGSLGLALGIGAVILFVWRRASHAGAVRSPTKAREPHVVPRSPAASSPCSTPARSPLTSPERARKGLLGDASGARDSEID
jgi:uncharacterized protein (DUF3084 family)